MSTFLTNYSKLRRNNKNRKKLIYVHFYLLSFLFFFSFLHFIPPFLFVHPISCTSTANGERNQRGTTSLSSFTFPLFHFSLSSSLLIPPATLPWELHSVSCKLALGLSRSGAPMTDFCYNFIAAQQVWPKANTSYEQRRCIVLHNENCAKAH